MLLPTPLPKTQTKPESKKNNQKNPTPKLKTKGEFYKKTRGRSGDPCN